jgi:hypothetical protein
MRASTVLPYVLVLLGGAVSVAAFVILRKQFPSPEPPSIYVGWRSSEYGVHYQGDYNGAPQQPSASGKKPASWFASASQDMASKTSARARASGIWIFGETISDVATYIDFPGVDTAYIKFRNDGLDPHEAYLTVFDNAGLKVWLQTEPQSADVNALTTLLMNRYGSHPCVLGVGIDAEWFPRNVTANDAASWTSHVKGYNTTSRRYKFFIKEYRIGRLPVDPQIADCVWICDSQGFGSENAMFTDDGGFDDWATHFAGSEIGFQVGYSADSNWTRLLGIAKLSSDILARYANAKTVIWSDEDILHYYP